MEQVLHHLFLSPGAQLLSVLTVTTIWCKCYNLSTICMIPHFKSRFIKTSQHCMKTLSRLWFLDFYRQVTRSLLSGLLLVYIQVDVITSNLLSVMKWFFGTPPISHTYQLLNPTWPTDTCHLIFIAIQISSTLHYLYWKSVQSWNMLHSQLSDEDASVLCISNIKRCSHDYTIASDIIAVSC